MPCFCGNKLHVCNSETKAVSLLTCISSFWYIYGCGSAKSIPQYPHDFQLCSDGLTLSRETSEVTGLDWENLGFGLIETDFMYVAKCGPDGIFSKGEVLPFGPIALSPSAGVLNYGQVSRESSHPV